MHKIKEKLMEELYEVEEKLKKGSGGKMSAGDLEYIHKLTDTIKNIDKIEMYEEYSEEGYSQEGGSSYARGRGRNARRDSMGRYSREGGSSYEGGGSSYEGGSSRGGSSNRGGSSYEGGGSYAGGSSYARGGRGGYSRGDAKEHMVEKMEEMMEMAESEKERQAIRQCIQKIENA